MNCLASPYMGSSLQPNGLIELPQVWGYVSISDGEFP